jgi:hypothetical protein
MNGVPGKRGNLEMEKRHCDKPRHTRSDGVGIPGFLVFVFLAHRLSHGL